MVFAPFFLMRSLNQKHRKKNKIANVLTFALDKKKKEGEIFLHAREKDLLYLFTHACLHLLSYSHKTEKSAKLMEKKFQFLLK